MTAGHSADNETWEVIVMEKNMSKNKGAEKNMQKGMNRTEFAQEYSLDTGKSNKKDKNNKDKK